MPAPVQEVLVRPTTTSIRISLEPTINIFHSLLLLAKTDEVTGFSDWVSETILSMSTIERRRHNLVMIGFFFAVQPDRSWPSFPTYIDHLESLAPLAFRDKLMNAYLRLPCQGEINETIYEDVEAILTSTDTFLDFLSQRFSAEYVDPELETQAYAYISDPSSMQSMAVTHLRHMWDKYMSNEWRQVKPMLQDAVTAFRQVDFDQMSQIEAAEYITGQSIGEGKLQHMLENAESLIFVPSAHVGPYLSKFSHGNVFGILFGARLPEGIEYYAPDLSRAEILVRLGALADDTRLRILRLISEDGEQRSKDIMRELELSQSAASRHLKQLSATGYLTERRCEGAKCYDINDGRVDSTLRALSAYLHGL